MADLKRGERVKVTNCAIARERGVAGLRGRVEGKLGERSGRTIFYVRFTPEEGGLQMLPSIILERYYD